MNTKRDLMLLATIVVTVAIAFLTNGILKLQKENKRLTNNQHVLLDSMHTYKVADSLNVAKVNVLELSLSDYKKYREEDAKLIKKLKADKLSASTSVNTVTLTKIKVQTKDSIIYKDRVVPIDTVKQINYDSKWTSVHGYLANDTANLNIENREELLIVESFTKKRFIGIKLPIWLFGYKAKSVDAVSKNPNTKITNLECIQIYK
jgi:hypothetical protein